MQDRDVSCVDVRERRSEVIPVDDVGGVDSLPLEKFSRGVFRCRCKGEHKVDACPGNVIKL